MTYGRKNCYYITIRIRIILIRRQMKFKEQVLEILNSSEGHMSAEEIYLYCANNGIKGSMASVYRVLGQLSEEGQVRKVSVPDQPDLFDKTRLEHGHAVCVRCGKARDIRLEGLKDALAKEAGEDIISYELCVRYICPECRKKEKN